MDPLLQVSDLSVEYSPRRGARVAAVRNVSLLVSAGETVGLLGESGSGKSSLALSLLRLLPANARISSGAIQYGRRNLLLLDQEELRRIRGAEIALIFQEPALALNPVLPVGAQIGDVLKAHRKLTNGQVVEQTYAMLREVGFPEPERIARAFPHQLSGGQQQRVAIAQALICRPRLLIADEPLSSLDTVTQAEILELLQRLKEELGLAMLFITHNARLLSSLAGRVAVLRHGQVVANGTPQELEQMADLYVREITSPAEVLPVTVSPETSDRKPLLQIHSLSKQFQQRRIFSRKKFKVSALAGIDLELFAGATVALVGRSGSGKSTLAKCIAGFETPDSGDILLEGISVHILTRQSRQQIQLLFQDTATSFNPRFTAEQLISEPLDIVGSGTRAERQKKALAAMQEVGLDPDASHRLPAEFSGGQRQRLALARALVVRPKLLILDEALSGLDIPLQTEMVRLLLDLQRIHNLAHLYISHDINFVAQFVEQIVVMHQGRIVEQIAPCKIQQSTNPETLALLAASLKIHAAHTNHTDHTE